MRIAEQLIWMQEHPTGALFVAMSAWLAVGAIGIAGWNLSETLEDNAWWKRLREKLNMGNSDEEMEAYFEQLRCRRIGSGLPRYPK